MKRWLVIFSSHPSPPADATAVDVCEQDELRAIAKARRAAPPHHPWAIATATPWPKGCPNVDEAVRISEDKVTIKRRAAKR